MRKAKLTTFTAVFCAAELAATLAGANPAMMAAKSRRPEAATTSSIWPWSKTSTQPAPAPLTQPPTAKISATHHPIQYLKSAASNLPVVSKGKNSSAARASEEAARSQHDPISLNTPTGPPTPEFYIYAGQMCEQQGDVPQARKNFQRALGMWPGHVEVLRAAARMEDRQANLPLAENLYQQAVTANPQHAGALNDLGLCLARQGKLEPSRQVLEQAVQLQPTKALYRNNAATVLVEMHQDQRALGHLAAVHGAADANFNLGQLLVQRGRGADAAPYFQAALQQNPNLQAAQEALNKLQGTQGSQVVVSTPPANQQPAASQPMASQPMAAQPMVSQMPVQAGPTVAPQQGWPTPPQAASYPATARVPGTDVSGSNSPRYLPPVATRPVQGPIRR